MNKQFFIHKDKTDREASISSSGAFCNDSCLAFMYLTDRWIFCPGKLTPMPSNSSTNSMIIRGMRVFSLSHFEKDMDQAFW